MFTLLKRWIKVRALIAEQRKISQEMQELIRTRNAITEREAYLMRYSKHLAVREMDFVVLNRRHRREAAGA